jgi:hypothetical protein
MIDFKSDLEPTPRPSASQEQESAAKIKSEPVYIWSYLLTRSVVGYLGISLPVVLIMGDVLFLAGSPTARGSLSAYYHSGMRDFFVGVLCVTGVFLISYKVFSRTIENALSSVAGIAAVGIAIFPTGLPADRETELTPLQVRLHESVVTPIHFFWAAVFIASLAAICCLFARRESRRDKVEPGRKTLGSRFWGPFHYVCAASIGLGVLFIVATKATGVLDDYSLLIGESIAVLAFGVSWAAKGAELRTLWPRKSPAQSPG